MYQHRYEAVYQTVLGILGPEEIETFPHILLKMSDH